MRSELKDMIPRFFLSLGLGLCITAVVSNRVVAQDSQFDEFHTWTDLATIYNFNENFRYDGDYGLRGVLTGNQWTLFYFRPSVRYRAKPWLRVHGGAALFYNFFQDFEDLPELRPWLGLRFLGPRPGGFVFSNYFRMELRAFYLKDAKMWDTGLRGRWQLQVTTPRFSIGSADQFYAFSSIEPFFNIGDPVEGEFGDRFRYNLGLGKQVSNSLRVDLNYLFHKVRVPGEEGSLNADDHVVRLRFFYSLN